MYRNEYPRPQFVRKKMLYLNGKSDFKFDDLNKGLKEQWFKDKITFSKVIQVPFAYHAELIGIYESSFHDYVWYRRQFRFTHNIIGKQN